VKTSERDRGVRGSIASAPWDENAHAHDQAVRHQSWGYVLHRDPPKRSPGVVKRSIPLVMPFGAQVSEGRPRCESGERSREHTRCGYSQFVWVAEIG
jgi:hypothetical protein